MPKAIEKLRAVREPDSNFPRAPGLMVSAFEQRECSPMHWRTQWRPLYSNSGIWSELA
jgi:hypothetical protein